MEHHYQCGFWTYTPTVVLIILHFYTLSHPRSLAAPRSWHHPTPFTHSSGPQAAFTAPNKEDKNDSLKDRKDKPQKINEVLDFPLLFSVETDIMSHSTLSL